MTLTSRFIVEYSIIIKYKYTRHVLKNPFNFKPYDVYLNIHQKPLEEPSFYMSGSSMNFILLFKFAHTTILHSLFSFNYTSVSFKKILCFFKGFRVFDLKNFISVYRRFLFRNHFVFWRPLIKKWSYFGMYRAYRSKWL